MTDNLTPAPPARFYGFAHERTIAESLAALKALQETAPSTSIEMDDVPPEKDVPSPEVQTVTQATLARPPLGQPACAEAAAGGEAECVPSTSTELVHVPRNEDAPSPQVAPQGRPPLVLAGEPGRSVQAVIDAILAQPPLDQQEPEPEPIKKRKRRKKKRQSPKTEIDEPQLSSLAMHEAHCMICNSEWREEMDELFVNWHNVSEIGREYHTPRRTVYRHAHAVGLFPIRDRNLRRSLGLIIHHAETAPGVTADSVIRAVRTFAHINDAGEWVDPPAHVIVSSGTAMHANKIESSSPDLLDTPCQAIESVKP
jgi:hypothetical protein